MILRYRRLTKSPGQDLVTSSAVVGHRDPTHILTLQAIVSAPVYAIELEEPIAEDTAYLNHKTWRNQWLPGH